MEAPASPMTTSVRQFETDPIQVMVNGGLPGFAEARRFSLVSWGDDGGPFSLLHSFDVDGLHFVVVRPEVFFPTYHAEIDTPTAERLDLKGVDDALVLVIITPGSCPAEATANLLGPIIVNRHTMRGAQLFLQGSQDLLNALLIER